MGDNGKNLDPTIIKALKEIVGPKNVTTSPAIRKFYSYGLGPGGDLLDGQADVVVLPRSTPEVAAVVKLANDHNIPLVPRGAGTSQWGTNMALFGGISLDLCLMDKIIDIDEDNMVAVAEGGCSTYKLMFELDKRGLAFPVSPLYTTGPRIGAAVACNITGCHMTRFGRMGDNLTGLEVVLPTGEVVVLGSGAYPGTAFYHRYVGGPDLIGLFVNAGGTTGVLTKVACRVKTKPAHQEILAYGWRRDDAGPLTKAMYEVQKQYVYDFFLLNEWNFYHAAKKEKRLNLPPEVHFIALISIDGETAEHLQWRVENFKKICRENAGIDLGELGRVAMGPPHYRMWHSVSPWLQHMQATYFYNPINKFPQVYDIYETLTKEYGFWNEEYLPTWYSFHCRNTMNPYPLLAISNPKIPEQLERIRTWWNLLNTEFTKIGCCQYLMGDALPPIVFENLGPLYDFMKKIKHTLDPNNIMNPQMIYGGR